MYRARCGSRPRASAPSHATSSPCRQRVRRRSSSRGGTTMRSPQSAHVQCWQRWWLMTWLMMKPVLMLLDRSRRQPPVAHARVRRGLPRRRLVWRPARRARRCVRRSQVLSLHLLVAAVRAASGLGQSSPSVMPSRYSESIGGASAHPSMLSPLRRTLGRAGRGPAGSAGGDAGGVALSLSPGSARAPSGSALPCGLCR